jgi:hypothetical protein
MRRGFLVFLKNLVNGLRRCTDDASLDRGFVRDLSYCILAVE